MPVWDVKTIGETFAKFPTLSNFNYIKIQYWLRYDRWNENLNFNSKCVLKEHIGLGIELV